VFLQAHRVFFFGLQYDRRDIQSASEPGVHPREQALVLPSRTTRSGLVLPALGVCPVNEPLDPQEGGV